MKAITSGLFASLFLALISNSAWAEKALSADEAKALFSNKTFDVHIQAKDKDVTAYSSADGAHTVKIKEGKTKEGTWSINDKGQHCVELKKVKCAKVISMGEGVYHKINDDEEHTHTLKNFVGGDQL